MLCCLCLTTANSCQWTLCCEDLRLHRSGKTTHQMSETDECWLVLNQMSQDLTGHRGPVLMREAIIFHMGVCLTQSVFTWFLALFCYSPCPVDNASLMRCIFTILRGLCCMSLVPRRSSMLFLLAWGLTMSSWLTATISLHRLASLFMG